MTDNSWRANDSIATSVAFSRRTANTVYSCSNSTLVSMSNISFPTPIQISPTDLFTVLNRIYSNGTSAIMTIFAATYFSSTVGTTPNFITPQIFLRALITLPLRWFQPNLYGNTTITQSSTSVTPNLPSELYVQGTLSQGAGRIIIARRAVIA